MELKPEFIETFKQLTKELGYVEAILEKHDIPIEVDGKDINNAQRIQLLIEKTRTENASLRMQLTDALEEIDELEQSIDDVEAYIHQVFIEHKDDHKTAAELALAKLKEVT